MPVLLLHSTPIHIFYAHPHILRPSTYSTPIHTFYAHPHILHPSTHSGRSSYYVHLQKNQWYSLIITDTRLLAQRSSYRSRPATSGSRGERISNDGLRYRFVTVAYIQPTHFSLQLKTSVFQMFRWNHNIVLYLCQEKLTTSKNVS